MEKKAVREQLSAMLDNELELEAVGSVLHELGEVDLYETAELYLLIGDVLREGNVFVAPSAELALSIRKRLKSESYLSVDLDETDDMQKKSRLTIQV